MGTLVQISMGSFLEPDDKSNLVTRSKPNRKAQRHAAFDQL